MADRRLRPRTLTEVLTFLHEHFSEAVRRDDRSEKFRRGHRAGMTFARVCVLDELTAEAIRSSVKLTSTAARGRVRERVVLRDVEARLRHERDSSSPSTATEFSDGYSCGIQSAIDYLGTARAALDLSEQPVDVSGSLRKGA